MNPNPTSYKNNQNTKYQDPNAVLDKWIRINRNINKYTDATTLLQSIREAFILVETVMNNTLQNYKANYVSYGELVSGTQNTYIFHYPTGDITIDFSNTSAFVISNVLRTLGYNLPDELDDTRRLRNFVSHNLETTTVEYFKENMSYESVVNAIKNLGQTLVNLNMLRPESISPSFEDLKAKEGETIGLSHEFTITRQIAVSGSSTTFEGIHNRLNTKIAIKELFPDTYSETLLMREKDLLVHLSHPQIPRIYDVFNQNGTFYIVMDYIDGMGLDSYLKSYNLSTAEKLRIISDICSVIHYLHADKQMIHTDLKPQNVMIDKNGMIHIIDFGTASTKYDTTGLRSVSAGFTAPEVTEGGTIDYRIDIYSIGAILRYMFLDELANLQNEYNEQIANISRVVACCMDRNPLSRYKNVLDIQKELADITNIMVALPQNVSKPKNTVNKTQVLAKLGRSILYLVLIATAIISLIIKIKDLTNKPKEGTSETIATETTKPSTENSISDNTISDEEALNNLILLEQQAFSCLVNGDEEGYLTLFRYDANSYDSLKETFQNNYQEMSDIYTDCDYILLCNENGLCFGSVTRTLVSGEGNNISFIRKEFTYPFSYKDGEWKFDTTAETNVITESKYKEKVYDALSGNFNDARTSGRNYSLLCGYNYIWLDNTLVYEGMLDTSVIAASQMMDGSVEFIISIKNGTDKECDLTACNLNLSTSQGNEIVVNYHSEISAILKSGTSMLLTVTVPVDAVQNVSAVWDAMQGNVTVE